MLFDRDPTNPVLEGPRVRLRPPCMKDYPVWCDLRRESAKFLRPWEPSWNDNHLERGAFRRRVRWTSRAAKEGRALAYLLFCASRNTLLGGITLENIRDWPALTGTFGYWIGAPHARHGYMTEGLGLLIAHAFDALGLSRLEAACLPENTASRGLLLGCGFVREGSTRAYLEINGRWRNHERYIRLHPERRDPGEAEPEPSGG